MKNKFNILLFITLLTGCSTSTYKINAETDYATEILVTPDRVALLCDPIPDHDEPDQHWFVVHVLDDQKTVVTVLQWHIMDSRNCQERLKTFASILKKGKLILISGTGNLSDLVLPDLITATFPDHGTFKGQGKTLSLHALQNELGEAMTSTAEPHLFVPLVPFR